MSVAPAPHHSRLLAGAQRFLREGYSAWRDGDRLGAAVGIGVGIELLAKAALAQRSPAYIVEMHPNNFGSLVGLLEARTGQRLRTVGLINALLRLRTLGVDARLTDTQLKAIADLRDDAAHAALVEEDQTALLTDIARLTEVLLADVHEDREPFWKELLPLIDTLLAERTRTTQEQVDLRKEQARSRFLALFAQLPAGTRDALLASLAEQPVMTTGEWLAVACPVCEFQAVAEGTYDVEWQDGWEEDDDGNAYRLGDVFIDVDEFRCPVCRLHLTGWEEIGAAGIDTRIKVEDVDPESVESPWVEFEPDEDWGRGR